MCPWMLLSPHPTAMAVGDLTADARFSKSVHVKGGTRAYLTSPLVASNGHRLGWVHVSACDRVVHGWHRHASPTPSLSVRRHKT